MSNQEKLRGAQEPQCLFGLPAILYHYLAQELCSPQLHVTHPKKAVPG